MNRKSCLFARCAAICLTAVLVAATASARTVYDAGKALRENFQNNREFLEALLDTTELLVEKMDGVDTIGVIDYLRALKRKILEACR